MVPSRVSDRGMGMKRGRDRGSVVRGLKPHTPRPAPETKLEQT